MVNILIADDNFLFAKKLMDYINSNSDVKVTNIALDGKEAIELLNNKDNIDIFLLDLKMPIYSGIEILSMLSKDKRKKYKHSCIVISGEIDLLQKLTKDDVIYTYIQKNISTSEILEKIEEIIAYKQQKKANENIKEKINSELINLKYNIEHIGTKYLSDTIYYVATNFNGEVMDLKNNIYPYIATKNKTSVHNIKCGISRATESMYYNCEEGYLKKYFNSMDEAKPKIKTIVNTICKKIC